MPDKSTVTPRLRFRAFTNRPLRDVRLGDVTAESTIRNGDEFPATSVMGVSKVDGIVPMVERIVSSDITRYKVVRKDWFAYNPMRLNIGSIARWRGDADVLVSPDYVVFFCLDDQDYGIEPDYLDQLRQSARWDAFVSEGGDGGVRIRIYYKDIARLELALPPRAEQRKIAGCLMSLDKAIVAQVQKVKALKIYKRGLMQQLFPCEGELVPQIRFPEFRDAPQWKKNRLEDLLTMSATYGIVTAGEFQRVGIPMLRGGDIKEGQIGENLPLVSKQVHSQYRRTSLRANDVVIALVGYPGEAAVIPDRYIGANISRAVGLLRPKRVLSHFLASYLNSPAGRTTVLKPSAGSAQVVVNLRHLNELMIPLPPTMVEQQRISACLSDMDRVIVAASTKLEALKIHKRGLMQQLFSALQGG
jgi:type I restriction enzyme S subunit